MYQGKIKKIMENGYGFIKCDDFKRDVFFHFKSVAKGVVPELLQEGETVQFDVEENERGYNALAVRPAEVSE